MVDAGMREMFVTGHDAQPRADAGRELPHQASADALEGRPRLVRGLPRRLGPRVQRVGLAVGRGVGPGFGSRISASSTRRRRPRSSTRRGDTAAASSRASMGSDAPEARAYFEAIPRSWRLSAADSRPDRMIDLQVGRERALAAYETFKAVTRGGGEKDRADPGRAPEAEGFRAGAAVQPLRSMSSVRGAVRRRRPTSRRDKCFPPAAR